MAAGIPPERQQSAHDRLRSLPSRTTNARHLDSMELSFNGGGPNPMGHGDRISDGASYPTAREWTRVPINNLESFGSLPNRPDGHSKAKVRRSDRDSRQHSNHASAASNATRSGAAKNDGSASKVNRHPSPKRLLLDAIASRKNSDKSRSHVLRTSRSKTFHHFGASLRPDSIFGFRKRADEVSTSMRFAAEHLY